MYKIIIWLTAQFSEIMKPEKSGTSCMKVFKKKKKPVNLKFYIQGKFP